MWRHLAYTAALAAVLAGVEASAQAPAEDLVVRYLDNEVLVPGKDYFVVRCAFEVDGPANRWIALDVELRISQAIPLMLPGGKMLLKRWNDLFLPESPRPVRWTDCRRDVDFKDLEAAENLPKDKRFVVWVMGLVFDYSDGKHIGSGWAVRAPLLVTTNKAGRVVEVQAPPLRPIRLALAPADSPVAIDAREGRLRTQYLRPRENARAYLAYPQDGGTVSVLCHQNLQAWRPEDFGGCFQPIETPSQAEELALLQHAGGVIVSTRTQYDAIVQALKKLNWSGRTLLPGDPKEFGPVVSRVEGLGYRVQMVVIEPRDGKLGDVAEWDFYVSTDGRIGGARKLCVRGPAHEDGKLITPTDVGVYTQALRAALLPDEAKDIPFCVEPTGPIVRLPLPADRKATQFLPAAAWPGVDQPTSRESDVIEPYFTQPEKEEDIRETPAPVPIPKRPAPSGSK